MWVLLAVLATSLILLFIAAVVHLILIHQQYAHIPGPKRSSFFLGHVTQIRDAENRGNFMVKQLTEWFVEYGHTICLFLLHRPTIFTVDPELVKEVMIQGHPKTPSLYNSIKVLFGTRYLGNFLDCNLDWHSWKGRRALIEMAFKRETMKSYLDEMNLIIDDLMSNLRAKADGKTTVTLLEEFSVTALNIIGKVGYSQDIDTSHSSGRAIHQAISQSLFGLEVMMFKGPQAQYLPSNWELVRKTKKAIAVLRNTAGEWAREREVALDAGQYVKEDILHHIIKAADITDRDQKQTTIDEIIGFMIAGQETAAGTMAFALMELGRHPDVLARARTEVDTVIGERSYVTHEDLGKLPYLSQVIKETLRLHSTVSLTGRRAAHDLMVGNSLIPEGTDISVVFYAMGLMPQFYPDPHKFDPDRFSPDAPNRPYTYTPFATGPFNCIGQNVAKMEMKIVLVKFLQHFKYTLDPTQSFGELPSTTIKPKSGVKVTLTLRDQHMH